MSDKVRASGEPFDRLTRLCAVMSDALEEALEAEETPKGAGPVRTIVFLEDDKKAGIQIFGYDDSISAMAALFSHMKAIFEAEGKSLDFVGVNVPDSPEGLS